MATQTRYPQSNEYYTGHGDPTYMHDPNNAHANDGAYASYDYAEYKQYTRRYYNFGFEIPAGSTINSVTMEFEVKKTGGGTDAFAEMTLYKNTTSRGSSYQKTSLPSSDTEYSSNDTGSWTVDELNANTKTDGPSLFLRYYTGYGWPGPTIYCDYVRITVDYTEPAVDVTFGSCDATAEAPAGSGSMILEVAMGVSEAIAEALSGAPYTAASAFPSRDWGLQFWEELVGLPRGAGNSVSRRQKIMSILSGWTPLTTARFATSLSRKLGGLPVEIKEYTASNTFTIYINGAYNPTDLTKALAKIKPAHLKVVVSSTALTAPDYSTS